MKLIKNPSDELFFNLIEKSNENILLCAPFVKTQIVKKILEKKKENTNLTLITVSFAGNFKSGASDVQAIKLLLENNVKVYNYQNLHAKCYIFDNHNAIVTSSNLTYSGFVRNYEYGCLINEENTIKEIVSDYKEMINNEICGEFNFDKIKDIKKFIDNAGDIIVKTDETLDNIVVVNDNSFDNLSHWKKVVINVINKINKIEFTREELKQYENYFIEEFPNSNTQMQRVSATLQDLRDMGLLKFYGNGKYKKLWESNNV